MMSTFEQQLIHISLPSFVTVGRFPLFGAVPCFNSPLQLVPGCFPLTTADVPKNGTRQHGDWFHLLASKSSQHWSPSILLSAGIVPQTTPDGVERRFKIGGTSSRVMRRVCKGESQSFMKLLVAEARSLAVRHKSVVIQKPVARIDQFHSIRKAN